MNVKKILFMTAAAWSLSMGLPTVFAADDLQRSHSTPGSTSDTQVTTPTAGEHHMDRDWNVKSSVQVTREALRQAFMAGQEAWSDKLKKYAKCSPEDAEKAVRTAHPGMKVSDIHLRNIHTNLVYVGFAEDQEDRYLVIVDAGNGKVLLDKPVPTHQERVFAGHN